MKKVKGMSFAQLNKQLLGNRARFKSDCELFPNFDIKGKVLSSNIVGTELVFRVKTIQGKTISVGSNMRNLTFEIIN